MKSSKNFFKMTDLQIVVPHGNLNPKKFTLRQPFLPLSCTLEELSKAFHTFLSSRIKSNQEQIFPVSENKTLCHPASVDSLSTSAGTEDHVSMGGFAARKALHVVENVEKVLACVDESLLWDKLMGHP